MGRGFSLLETLLAAVVLSVGLLAAVTLYAPALRHAMAARDQAVATALAQEGVEIVRNLRDNAMLAGTSLAAAFPHATTACVSYDAQRLTPCGSRQLRIAGGMVVAADHSGGTATPFRRTIYVVPRQTRLHVYSYVTWRNGTMPTALDRPQDCTPRQRCVFARVTLTDWRR